MCLLHRDDILQGVQAGVPHLVEAKDDVHPGGSVKASAVTFQVAEEQIAGALSVFYHVSLTLSKMSVRAPVSIAQIQRWFCVHTVYPCSMTQVLAMCLVLSAISTIVGVYSARALSVKFKEDMWMLR